MTESTSSQHIENQQEAVAHDLLEATAEDGSLKSAVLYWDHVNYEYHDSSKEGLYHNDMPESLTLGKELKTSFTDRGIAYNLRVNYMDDGETRSWVVVNQGEPTDQSVTATQKITLYDSDSFYDENEDDTGEELQNNEHNFYISDEGSGELYNVVEIELIVWRM
uniref:DUF7288 family protein n=1 Tax=Natronococcus wangiae TaxID=3068275 RepID=UPI00273D5BA0|nr:hypothetical protein [Natronococcus sp. AD5]